MSTVVRFTLSLAKRWQKVIYALPLKSMDALALLILQYEISVLFFQPQTVC